MVAMAVTQADMGAMEVSSDFYPTYPSGKTNTWRICLCSLFFTWVFMLAAINARFTTRAISSLNITIFFFLFLFRLWWLWWIRRYEKMLI